MNLYTVWQAQSIIGLESRMRLYILKTNFLFEKICALRRSAATNACLPVKHFVTFNENYLHLFVYLTLEKPDLNRETNQFLRDNLALIDMSCLTDGNKRIMYSDIDY